MTASDPPQRPISNMPGPGTVRGRLEQLFEKFGTNAHQAANAIGVSPSYFSQGYERATFLPQYPHRKALADFLNVNVELLSMYMDDEIPLERLEALRPSLHAKFVSSLIGPVAPVVPSIPPPKRRKNKLRGK